MIILSVKHKGLRRLIEQGDASGVPAEYVRKIRNMIAYLQDAEDMTDLTNPPKWKCHELGGDRKGTWALAVTGNWRITFSPDSDGKSIRNLFYEDYH
ncbi:MAG: type II toxin-antitoxin system RelE/ParE family toxin [Nitrospinae bacterium]|nr:type II toxin-antitoxin system RelE/ParE family toxin [Nitrospinota bacterium]